MRRLCARKLALIVTGLVFGMCTVAMVSSSAFGAACVAESHEPNGECHAGWELTARTFPTNLAPKGSGALVIDVMNIGGEASTGTVTVTDTLPAGLTAREVEEEEGAGELVGFKPDNGRVQIGHSFWDCTGNGLGGPPGINEATVVTCTNDPTNMPSLAGGGGTPMKFFEGPNLDPQLAIAVNAPGAAISEPNRVTIAGGGAPTSASTTDTISVSAKPASFGFVGWDGWASNADGTIDTQAGSHPYEVTFSGDLATAFKSSEGQYSPVGGQPRDIEVNLPAGLIGDPYAIPQCTRQELDSGGEPGCPADSQVGIVRSQAVDTLNGNRVFNMVPPAGVPAELAFLPLEGGEQRLDVSVRTGSDYGLTAHNNETPERDVTGFVMTLWGVPGDPSHDKWRTNNPGGCSEREEENPTLTTCKPVGSSGRPFFTLPTACTGPQTFTIRANSWQNPAYTEWLSFQSHDSNLNEVGITGCEDLSFGPSMTTAPDTAKADTPAGLTVEVKPPIGGLLDPNGVGTSDIKETTVTLPPGLVINPGQAAGLQGCQESESGLGTEDAPSCPLASKVGTVTAKTPLLEHAAESELTGNVYVLQSNPPNLKLLAAFSGDGVNIKLVLNVHLDEATGQITTKVANIPEFPASDFKLSFSGGAQAALDTPTQCGTYTTNAAFSPWSSPFIAGFNTNGSFAITEGPGGGPCPSNPMPFGPNMIAGSTTDQAGAFTNFSLLLQRGDGQQRIEKLQFKEPAGLAGLISSVPLCPEPQASQGTCDAASHIGHAVVTSGPGPYPLVLPQPGAPELPVYLTGPYEGAPFGLSIVTPVIAGPFNLGTIVTRAKIEVDPRTAQITITTDALPQIVKGVPTDLRQVNSIIDRPGFLFNPTNCNPQEFTGTAYSSQGATAPLQSHFGVGSCQSLKFSPKLTVSTAGKTSKANGASLLFKISYPKGAMGTQSWFNEAKFAFPKQLPARLTTIQKACLASVFESNPAACPPGSLIGHAVVHTQVLPVPLEGPVYFVSYGAAKFPDAVLVLQGDGVTVDLHGETFINGKTGVTSATFANTPDVPFESIEVTVPSGPTSEFAANLPAKAKGSFCGQKLVMPTLLKAQNGLEVKQSTLIGVSGCKKVKKATRAQLLAKAMKACRKKPKGRRAECARAARRRYGVVKKK